MRVIRSLRPAPGLVHCCVLALVATQAAVSVAGQTTRINVRSGGGQSVEGVAPNEGQGSVSADGRFVAFSSEAPDLVPGDTNGRFCPFGGRCLDVFVHDRVLRSTERVDVSGTGAQANGSAGISPSLSSDGRFVAFYAWASNLVPDDANGAYDVFVRDRLLGTTERVSVATDGTQGDGWSYGPAISGDGRFVAFHSYATNLVPDDTNDQIDVFVHDRLIGTTERVSVSSAEEQTEGADRESYAPSISGDGRFVAFISNATNLVPDDHNGQGGSPDTDIFVRDRLAGTTERVNVSSSGAEADDYSNYPRLSADGRFVSFVSEAGNLVPGGPNVPCYSVSYCRREPEVFVHDRLLRITERVSELPGGERANGDSGRFVPPEISADGRHVAFWSDATNLHPGRAGGIFVKDRSTGELVLADVASDGTPGDYPARKGIGISADGRFVSFASSARGLVPDDTNNREDQFLHDLTCGDGVVAASEQCDDGNATSGDGCEPTCTVAACSGGAPASDARLTASNEGVLRGHTLVRFAGSFDLPVLPAATFEPERGGVQLVVEDLGRPGSEPVVVDLAAPGFAVPEGGRGTGCHPRDGWVTNAAGRVRIYLNRSGSVDAPTCTPGSAAGLRKLVLRDRRGVGGGIAYRAHVLAPRWDIVGPLRGTLTLGASEGAGALGACTVARFTDRECATRDDRRESLCTTAVARPPR